MEPEGIWWIGINFEYICWPDNNPYVYRQCQFVVVTASRAQLWCKTICSDFSLGGVILDEKCGLAKLVCSAFLWPSCHMSYFK